MKLTFCWLKLWSLTYKILRMTFDVFKLTFFVRKTCDVWLWRFSNTSINVGDVNFTERVLDILLFSKSRFTIKNPLITPIKLYKNTFLDLARTRANETKTLFWFFFKFWFESGKGCRGKQIKHCIRNLKINWMAFSTDFYLLWIRRYFHSNRGRLTIKS